MTDRPHGASAHGTAADARPNGTMLRALVLRHPGWSVAAVLFIAFNLRPAITAVALFLRDISRDFGLSALGISVLTMAPVVCLGLFAPLVPASRAASARSGALRIAVGIAIGSVVRSFGGIPSFSAR